MKRIWRGIYSKIHGTTVGADQRRHGIQRLMVWSLWVGMPVFALALLGARRTSYVHELYCDAFGPRRYWFAYANALFVGFDNAVGEPSQQDVRWLDQTLHRLRSKYSACFVLMHVPPRDPRPGRLNTLQPAAEAMVRVMKKPRSMICGRPSQNTPRFAKAKSCPCVWG